MLVYNYILYLLDLQSKMWTVCLFYRKNTNGNKLTKPSLKKKIETKKRSLPKAPLDHLMESPTDTLQLDETTSASILKNFQEYIVAQNHKEFNIVIDHFILLERTEKYDR